MKTTRKPEQWSKAPKGPFGAYKTLLRNDTAAQRFSVYRIPTYHDKTRSAISFADGDALAVPDSWMPDDHPQKGTT
jgi:hypothetical protein